MLSRPRYWVQVVEFFVCELMSVISIHLPKMSEIYLTVLELGPDNLGGNVADVNQFSCMGDDVMLTVTRSMTSRTCNVIRSDLSYPVSYRVQPISRYCPLGQSSKTRAPREGQGPSMKYFIRIYTYLHTGHLQ